MNSSSSCLPIGLNDNIQFFFFFLPQPTGFGSAYISKVFFHFTPCYSFTFVFQSINIFSTWVLSLHMLFPLFVVLFFFLIVCLALNSVLWKASQIIQMFATFGDLKIHSGGSTKSQNIHHILHSNALGKTVMRHRITSMH